MIIARRPEGLRLVTQNDHAHLASEILSLWRDDGLARHPRRSELLFAVREHDNGWRESDSAPRVDPASGSPYDFITAPATMRQEIWLRGIDRYREDHPYATLLIAHHALHLHRRRHDDPAYADFLEEVTALHATQRDEVGLEETALGHDYGFLELTDLLSLAVSNDWSEPFECRGMRVRHEDGALFLAPFPLAGATTFRLACRTIPDRPYSSDTDLTLELARARWGELSVRICPA